MRYTLKTLSLNDPPTYKALSYVWGDINSKESLVLNGATCLITKNLDIALRHLQHEDSPEPLWVDSLCINQEDNDEKSEQVQRMKSIYESASEVIVWLGPSANNSDLVMDFLAELGKQACELGLPEQIPQGGISWPESPADERLQALRRTFNQFMKRAGPMTLIDAYSAFVQRDWWKRVWVAQELAVAKKPIFLLGNKTMAFDHLNAAVDFWSFQAWESVQSTFFRTTFAEMANDKVFYKLARVAGLAATSMLSYRYFYENRTSDKRTLYNLLIKANTAGGSDFRLRASNERDYIYGLLGLLEDVQKLGIVVDYGKEWPLVYIEVARKLIERGHVDLLSLCQKEDFNSSDNMPSWTPDWRYDIQQRIKEPFVAGGAPIAKPFSASGNTFSHLSSGSSSEPANAVALQGITVDAVKIVGNGFISDDRPGADVIDGMSTFLSEIALFCQKSAKIDCKVYTPQQQQEASWRVPLRDLEMNRGTPGGGMPHRATYLSLTRYRGFIHLIKANKSYQMVLNASGAPVARLLVQSAYFLKSIYHLGSFWLQRTKYSARCTWWIRNKFHLMRAHLLGGADAVTVVTESMKKDWDKVEDEKPELYCYTMSTVHKMRPFMTEKGYVGVGPEHLFEGDMICILLGGTVPFVLRPHPTKQDGYRVVGEAYVYGIMDGEYMEGKEKSEIGSLVLY